MKNGIRSRELQPFLQLGFLLLYCSACLPASLFGWAPWPGSLAAAQWTHHSSEWSFWEQDTVHTLLTSYFQPPSFSSEVYCVALGTDLLSAQLSHRPRFAAWPFEKGLGSFSCHFRPIALMFLLFPKEYGGPLLSEVSSSVVSVSPWLPVVQK